MKYEKLNTNDPSTIKALQFIPQMWAHKHYMDETGESWDRDFVDVCEVCRERLNYALEDGRACQKCHLPIFEGQCEACEEGL